MEAQRILASRYAADFPAETARRLETVPPAEVAAFFGALSPEVAVGAIDCMFPSTVAAALEGMGSDELSPILATLAPARCVLVLRAVAQAERARMLALLPEKRALAVERLLRSARGSVGEIAEPIPAELSPFMTVGEAAHVVNNVTALYVYVVDDDHRLVGVIHRRDLATSGERARVRDLMTAEVIRLPAAAPQNAVMDHPAWKRLDALPVVDSTDVLVGVIRHKNLRRLGETPTATASGQPSALDAFLDLGELYWGTLASLITATQRQAGPGKQTEVENGR